MSEQETVSNILGPLEQLLPGEQLRGEQDTYTVEKYLGVGLTAQVYCARRDRDGALVALKVLRADASPVTVEHFWHEAQILGELRAVGVTAAPAMLDRQRQEKASFLVMEYVDRAVFKPVDELLATGPLPEAQALEIARQALDVLDRLHTRVGRTYTDMQLKNFWWNVGTQRLKILDWNHVSTQRDSIQPAELRYFGVTTFEELAQRDLARFGAYLYFMLTGKGALERGEAGGLVGGPLARRAGAQWEAISVAARLVVLRALHPDPTRCYQTAAEFLADVQEVQRLWQNDIDQLAVRQAYQDAEKAQLGEVDEVKRLRLMQAWRDLDMLERRGMSVPARYRERMLPLLRPGFTGVWSSGKLYYESQQYRTALSKWEPEAQTQQRAVLWRWVCLAQTGVMQPEFSKVQTELETLVEILSGEPPVDFAAAWSKWEQLIRQHPWIGDAPVGVLGQEIRAAQYIQDGDAAKASGEWGRAVEAYMQADSVLNNIAYGNLLREERGWQGLAEWIKEAVARRDALNLDTQQTRALQDAFSRNAKEGLGLLKTRFVALPENEPLVRFCLDHARKLSTPEAEVSASALETALNILDTALRWSHVPALYADLRAERERVYTALHRVQLATAFEPQAKALEKAVESRDGGQIGTLSARIAADPLLREHPDYPDLIQVIDQAFQEDIKTGRLTDAGYLLEALRRLDPDLQNDARRRETLKTRAEELTREKWALETRLAELQKEKEEAEQQWQAEREAKHAEVQKALNDEQEKITQAQEKTGKLLAFQDWTREQYVQWQMLEQQTEPDYAALIEQADAVLKTARQDYADLEAAFGEWQHYVEQRKRDWQTKKEEREKRQETFRQQEQTLEQVAQSLTQVQVAIGQLTADSLAQAEQQLTEAEEKLRFDLLPEFRSRYDELVTYRRKLVEFGQHVGTRLLPAVNDLRCKIDTVKKRLDEQAEPAQVEAALRDMLHAVSTTQRQAWEAYWRKRFGPEVTTLFPALYELARDAVGLSSLFPTSAVGQGLLDLLESALTTWRTGIEQKLDEQQKSLTEMLRRDREPIQIQPVSVQIQSWPPVSVSPGGFQPEFSSPSDLPAKIEGLSNEVTRLHQESRQLRWWGIGIAATLVVLLAIGMAMLGAGLGWQWPRRTPIPVPTVTVSMEVPTVETPQPTTPTPTSTSTVETPQPTTPTPTVETPQPTAESQPILTPDVSISWTRGISLYDMPPLTLTAQAGWILTPTAEMTQVLALAPSGEVYTLEVRVVDTVSNTQQLGTFAIISPSLASWQPDPDGAPLWPGEHQVLLQATDAHEKLVELATHSLAVITPTRVIVLQRQVLTTPNTKEISEVEVGSEIEITGRTIVNRNTLLRVRRPGVDEVLWVPTGKDGATEGPDAYVKPIGRWKLADILIWFPEVNASAAPAAAPTQGPAETPTPPVPTGSPTPAS